MNRLLACLAVVLLLVGTCHAPRLSAVTTAPATSTAPAPSTQTVAPGDNDRWRLPDLDLASGREHRLYKRAQRKIARMRKRLERRDGRLTTGGIVMVVGGSVALLGLLFYVPLAIHANRDETGCLAVLYLPFLVAAGTLAGLGVITLIVGLILHFSARAIRPAPSRREKEEYERRDG